jgi:two-component system nitrogen regulation response regulator GlnG
MKRYRWPGNVRELENLIRRLAALYPQDVITANIVDTELAEPSVIAGDDDRDGLPDEIGPAVERFLNNYFSQFGEALPPPGLYHRILREIEQPLLGAALAATRGNQIRAAELLGLNRNTLRKKIRDLDLRVIRNAR